MSLLSTAIVVASALAQGAGAARTDGLVTELRLGAVYREVEAKSPLVRAARASVRAGAARVGPVSRLPDPELQLATMNRNLPGFALNDPLGMNQIQLMQTIPLGGRIGRSADAARARTRAADARVPETLVAQRALAARQFFTLYRLDRSLTVVEETRALLRRLERTTETMYAVGRGRQADVLRAQLEIARMTEDLVRMQTMRVAEGARLGALLDSVALDTTGRPVLPSLDFPLPSADSLVALAVTARPMLQAAAEDVAAAVADERHADRLGWPDLTVGAIYGQRAMPEGSTDRMLSLMVGASVPIWAGSRQKQMRLEAAAMREMAEAELASLRAETRAAVLETLAELERSSRLSALYRGTILPQAIAAVRSALAAYEVGAVDFMTVLDNQMTVNRYRIELIGFTADRGIRLAELEMLTGQRWIDPDSVAPEAPGGVQ